MLITALSPKAISSTVTFMLEGTLDTLKLEVLLDSRYFSSPGYLTVML